MSSCATELSGLDARQLELKLREFENLAFQLNMEEGATQPAACVCVCGMPT